MIIISWNVNGIRAGIRKGTFLSFIQKYDPDIICLQETRAQQDQVKIDLPNYTEYWNSAKRKGYSGTAIFSKKKSIEVLNGFLPSIKTQYHLHDDDGRDGTNEGRLITLEYSDFFLVTVYTPNAKYDLSRLAFRRDQWDPAFLAHCIKLNKKKPVIFCGDLNVAHEEIDLSLPKKNYGNTGFTIEERKGFDNFIKAGFIDTYRFTYPNKTDAYTWWSLITKARERNIGWRIDYVCVSKSLIPKIQNTFILSDIMGSDHCPVGITIK